MTPTAIRKLIRRFDARRIAYATVSLTEATALLRGLPPPGGPIVIITRTEPENLYRWRNPYGPNICVVKRRSVLVKRDYEAAVNERRVRERKPADFAAAGRPWGSRIDLPFVLHRGPAGWKIYLSVHVQKNLGVEYFTADLVPIPLEDLQPFFKPPRKGGTRQGLRREIVYRDYELPHVLALNIPDARGKDRGYIIEETPLEQGALAPGLESPAPRRGRKLAEDEAVRHGLAEPRPGAGSRRKGTRGAR